MNKCSYCNGLAVYQFFNGKWCCGNNMNKCPEIRRRRSEETKKSWASPLRGTIKNTKAARRSRNAILTHDEQANIINEFRKGASINYLRENTGRGVNILKRLLKKSGVKYDLKKAMCKFNRMERATINLFKKNSVTTNMSLKKIIKQHNLLPHDKCWECGISKWIKGNITLELDHIDGNNKNNNISNLRFLCPNCHSQTPTFRGRSLNTGKCKVSNEDLIESIKQTKTIRQALIKVGLSPRGNNYIRANLLKSKLLK